MTDEVLELLAAGARGEGVEPDFPDRCEIARDALLAELARLRRQRDDAINGRDDLPMSHEILVQLKKAEAELAAAREEMAEYRDELHVETQRRSVAEAELAEAREDVARCAADTTAADLAQEVAFLEAEREQMRGRIERLERLRGGA